MTEEKLEANWDTWDYGSREPLFLPLEDFTEREKELLIKSETFCMLPWIHVHGYPDGKAYPCCLAEYDHPVGSLKENTMEEVWRDQPMQHMRENMLANKTCKECTKCYEQEAAGFFSMRNSSNQRLGITLKKH